MKSVCDYFSFENQYREEKALFEPFFHFACHRSELKQHNSYVLLNLFGNDIIVYNDNGNIICFDNICPHRGAPFLCGRENEGCEKLQCPYHGWQYDNGKLIIPNRNQFRHEELENIDLLRYETEYCGDFVFIAKTPHFTLNEQLGDFYEILEKISYSIDSKIDLNRNAFDANWKISLENALENYHVPSVHPNTLAPLELSNGEIKFDRLNSIWISDIKNKKVFTKLKRLNHIFDESIFRKENYFSIYLFPFSMISSTFGYSYAFQSFFPDTPQSTSFYSRTYSVKSKLDTEPFYNSVKGVNRQIFDEDIRVCNMLQKALKGKELDFVYSELEKRIVNFQSNYNQYMETQV